LGTSVSSISEGNGDGNTESCGECSVRLGTSSSNGNGRDDSIREGLKSRSNGGGSVSSGTDGDGSGLPLSSEQVSVGNGNGTRRVSSSSTINDGDGLNLVFSLGKGQDVVTTRALAERAVSSLIVRVADTSLDLLGIPKSVGDSTVGSGSEITVGNLELTAVTRGRELLDVVASTVARAVVGAGGSSASLSSVSLEALTLTSGAIAVTLVGALSIGVGSVGGSGGINPGQTVAANTLRAVSTLPVSVASASVLRATGSVTRAKVGAGGSSDAEGGSNSEGR